MKPEDWQKLPESKQVLKYIEQFGSINAVEACKDLGIRNLENRIDRLRRSGVRIYGLGGSVTTRFKTTLPMTRYVLAEVWDEEKAR